MDLDVFILANARTMVNAVHLQVHAIVYLVGLERIAAYHVLKEHLASFANRIAVA